jgi:rod shape-determining protein MreD
MIVLAQLMQGVIAPHLAIARVKPDLVLLVTLAYGLLYGPGVGGRFGLISGLLQDLLLGRYLGVFALTRMTAGYLAGLAERRLYRDSLLILTATGAGASIFADLLFMVLMGTTGYPLDPLADIGRVVMPAAVYNGLLAPLVYRAMHRLRRWERTWTKDGKMRQ